MNPDKPEPDLPELDPWGLKEVEELLRGLDGVQSLKIVPDGDGGVDEVHVVGTDDLSPKRIVRNIESALLAEFGLQIDHRKISVARMGDAGEPDISPQKAAPSPPAAGSADDRWLLLEGLQIDRKTGQRVGVRVTLKSANTTYEGAAEGADFSRSRLEVAAKAVLKALVKATVDDVHLRLEGVTTVELVGREMVAVLVQGQERRRTVSLPGVSLVEDSREEAAVLACLQATNRWAGAP